MVVMATTAMAQIDVTKTYRIKDVASGNYLTAFNHDAHSTGAVGGVGVAELDENSKEQVFYLEPTSAGYFLRLSSGDYYVIGQGWNVDALDQNGTIFNFEDAGEGNFYLKKGSTYFKTQTVDDKTYVFCDAPEDLKATWELEVVGESGYATYNTFNANKAYVIKSRERGGLTINGDATGFCSTNDAGRGTFVEHANTDNHFAVVTYEEKSYLYSVEAKKFLKADLTLTGGIGDVVAFRDASAEGASRMSIYFKEVTDANINIGGSNQIQVNYWSAIDHGNAMLFVEVADFDPAEALAVLSDVAEVTYNFVYEGVTVGTQTTTIEKGAAYPAIDVTKFPFGFTATTPIGTVDTDTERTIELTATFSWADSYENITAWYYLDLKDGKYLFYEEGQTNIPLTKTEVDSNNKDAYTWGFIGDPVNGFQIVNYAAGSSMILSSTTNTFDGNTGGSTYPVMTTTPVPDGNNTLWIFTASTYRENGFYIGQKDNASNRLNSRDSKLAYWTGGANDGSTFIMTERPMGPVAELDALIAEIEAKGITSGTNPGEYSVATVTALNEAIATAKALETVTADDVVALQAAYDALNVNPITAGLYRIVNAKPAFNNEKVLTAYGVCGSTGTASTPAWTQIDENDPLQYFNIEVDGDNYYVKAADDNYITSAGTLGSEPVAATFTWVAAGQYNITIAGDVLHANLHNWGVNTSNIIGYGSGADNPSAWKLVAVNEAPSFTHTLTVSEAGWATLVLGFNAAIPTGVKAYTIDTEEDGYVTLAEATGVLKANVPVLVEAAAGDYVFAYTAEAATVTESGLKGTLYNKNIAEEAYVLSIVDDVVGLYKAKYNVSTNTENDGTAEEPAVTYEAWLNNANKAYFVPTSAQANVASYSFRFGEGTTGVEEITENREQSTVIYDLTGRRVEAITAPGIYVVGGRKVLVK